jgi:hypothetical protein
MPSPTSARCSVQIGQAGSSCPALSLPSPCSLCPVGHLPMCTSAIQTHDLKVTGSNPVPATISNCETPVLVAGVFVLREIAKIPVRSPRTSIFNSPASGVRMISFTRERRTSPAFSRVASVSRRFVDDDPETQGDLVALEKLNGWACFVSQRTPITCLPRKEARLINICAGQAMLVVESAKSILQSARSKVGYCLNISR